MRAYSLFLLLLVCVCAGGCAEGDIRGQHSGGPVPPAQAAYDVVFYDLDVRLHPGQQRIKGQLALQAVAKDSLEVLVLDLDHRLTVTDAWQLGSERRKVLRSERREGGNRLQVHFPSAYRPGDTVQVAVSYSGEPHSAPNPPWEGGVTWSTTPHGAPWIATSSQTVGPDVWWPAKDHPSDEPDSMDISLTVPDTLVAASNGRLREVERASDSTSTYHWHVSMPINAYAVSMNVAPYVRLDTTYTSITGMSVPARFYALPSDSARAAAALPGFISQLRFLEKMLGPFPPRGDKYGVAQAPFLGMEHQSLLAYGHTFSNGGLGYDASFDALHFHELAHEWYGNLVTARDWKDFWLHEGPATYLEALYAEHQRGDSAYHAVIDHFRSQLQGGAPIAHRRPTTAQSAYHRDVYYRGALMLHTLRYVVGEEVLRAILQRFAYPGTTTGNPRPPFRQVTTRDFIQRTEQVAGQSLDAFFEVYLYQGALPVLDTTRSGDVLRLRWEQIGEAAFEVPVPIRIDGTVRRVAMPGGEGKVGVSPAAEVRIDPKGWILSQG